jgi:hypothetical protein
MIAVPGSGEGVAEIRTPIVLSRAAAFDPLVVAA